MLSDEILRLNKSVSFLYFWNITLKPISNKIYPLFLYEYVCSHRFQGKNSVGIKNLLFFLSLEKERLTFRVGWGERTIAT